jgi:hypothetical protein
MRTVCALVVCCARIEIQLTRAQSTSETGVRFRSSALFLEEHGTLVVIITLSILQLDENLCELVSSNLRTGC